MQGLSSFKLVFLKRWLMGLKLSGVASGSMSLFERKRAIQLSADVAMAFARDGAHWSRALISNLSKEEESKTLVKRMLGGQYERLVKLSYARHLPSRSKKIVRRSIRVCSRTRKRKQKDNGLMARILAKGLVKKRTKVLKSLIPGGNSLHDSALLYETLDYVTALRAQVELMQLLTKILGVSSPSIANRGISKNAC